MYRIIYFFIGLFLTANLSAKTFLGVEELASKAEAMKILRASYNILQIQESGSDITVADPSFAGFNFSLATFYFTPIRSEPRFNGVTFQRWFQSTQVNDAKEFRDAIMKSLKKKYGEEVFVEFKNDQGFRCVEFGTFKYGAIGVIELCRSKGKDGRERLYVMLTYYPFDESAVEDEL